MFSGLEIPVSCEMCEQSWIFHCLFLYSEMMNSYVCCFTYGLVIRQHKFKDSECSFSFLIIAWATVSLWSQICRIFLIHISIMSFQSYFLVVGHTSWGCFCLFFFYPCLSFHLNYLEKHNSKHSVILKDKQPTKQKMKWERWFCLHLATRNKVRNWEKKTLRVALEQRFAVIDGSGLWERIQKGCVTKVSLPSPLLWRSSCPSIAQSLCTDCL